MRRAVTALALGVLCLPLAALQAAAAVTSYQYFLSTRQCGRFDFAGPVSTSAPYRYDIETDSRGRMLRSTRYWNGVAVIERDNTAFTPSGFPSAWTRYENGVAVGKTVADVDSADCERRLTDYTMDGTETGYMTMVYTNDTISYNYFTADGAPKGSAINFFNDAGILNRVVTYRNPNNPALRHDVSIDVSTGLTVEDRQYDHGGLTSRRTYAYDNYGVPIHSDGYNAAGRVYVTDDYTLGFLTRRHYVYDNRDTRTLTIANDSVGRIISSEQRDNDVLRATFKVERKPDSTVTRTLAYGADGSLLAEYPNVVVIECNANGSVPGEYKGIFHKPPPWW